MTVTVRDAETLVRSASGEGASPRLAIVLKGYPRLSETFIAQEILALEQAGYSFDIWSLRRPTDRYRHPMHEQITARLFYLPEYLRDDPRRVAGGFFHALRRLNLRATLSVFLRDLRRDFSASRVRRFGQALVLAREVDPAIHHLHVHFLHTPASVTRYAALLTGRSFSFSAHAKDIWTTPEWERREKIGAARWGVTCTRDGRSELRRVAEPGHRDRVELVYHGLDLARFPAPPEEREPTDGSDPARPVRLLAVGRAVEKKGFDDLLAALGRLPPALHWRLVHIGGGELLDTLKSQAEALGLADRIEWRGSQAQGAVVEAMRQADLFVLPSRPAGDGDRDGLPNVLMEAATQKLPAVSTDFAGVPEFIENGVSGVLVPPKAPVELAAALERLIVSPAERQRLGQAAYQRLISAFSFEAGVSRLDALMRPLAAPRPRP
ncbi:glycosyltransferase family 4 protein [Ancylobacter sonchi]|uniref:glycosyltransferase family 4 protein n=1 Tax=Ancylobacter sonchi TaxID=1937790 RepID=UPI001BD2311A|nr:glycosyltransferase family 4 protein [Ancylobacter sonchi]MBS7535464.1 glycosyltransferase family 4 protein [Ancylobacter sonchi]